MRYVGGYVIFSLKKHYNGLKKSSVLSTRTPTTAALDFFTSLDTRFEVDVEARSYLEYTKKWVELRNRGGLVTINDVTFIFMRRLENQVRHVLTPDLLKKGEDLRDAISTKLNENNLVKNGWNVIAGNLNNEN